MMLNVKSNYSLLSSMLKIDDIIAYAIKNNYPAVALCDINMYGVMYFYKNCQKNNIKPIIGLSITSQNIALYAKDYDGYKSLIKLSTIQNEREIVIDDLKKYNKNVICGVDFLSKENYDKYKEI